MKELFTLYLNVAGWVVASLHFLLNPHPTVFVCPSHCCRVHQCLSMPGPLPTLPMATPQCWQTSSLWSWSDGTALWVRAPTRTDEKHEPSICAATKPLWVTDDKIAAESATCEETKFTIYWSNEFQLALLLLRPLACTPLTSNSLAYPPASDE